MIKHTLPIAELNNGNLSFTDSDGFETLCHYGAFHLKYPKGLDFDAGIKLAKNYYLPQTKYADEAYRGYRTRDLRKSRLGYSQTGNDQDELLQIECTLWYDYFPISVARLLWSMNECSRQALETIFALTDVLPKDQDKITGGMRENTALQYCIFNHFRSGTPHPNGLTPHKDSGFITTLYTTEPGLESLENDEWIPFDPKDGYFTVVIGHALEILTANLPHPINASYHRVRNMPLRPSTQEERFTFGTYIGPRWEQDLYQYDQHRTLRSVGKFLDFQKQKAKEMAYEFHPKVENPLP